MLLEVREDVYRVFEVRTNEEMKLTGAEEELYTCHFGCLKHHRLSPSILRCRFMRLSTLASSVLIGAPHFSLGESQNFPFGNFTETFSTSKIETQRKKDKANITSEVSPLSRLSTRPPIYIIDDVNVTLSGSVVR